MPPAPPRPPGPPEVRQVRRCVIDASVAAQWYFPERLTPHADALLAGSCELLAPDYLYVEIAGLLARRVRLGEIDEEAAHAVLAELRQVPFEWTPVSALVPAALPLALRADLPLSSSLYLALAMRADCPLVTADRQLYEAARAARLGRHLVWLGDLAAE
jgi:predicted nucleic acid-binding protein